MSGSVNHQPANRRPLIRPITALGTTLGATLVALSAGAASAQAAPPPLDPDTSGPAVLPVSTITTALPEGMTTGEVVIISLLTSLAVAALLVGVAFLLQYLHRSVKQSVRIPAQRTSASTISSATPATKTKVSSR